jgi:hypothetical protein
MKRFLVLGVFVCLVSCIADTSDPSAMDDPSEDVAETQEPVMAASPTPEEVKAALTGWVAYMSGTDFIPCKWGVIGVDCRHAAIYPGDPRQADEMGHVVLAKNGNKDPKNQIIFSLTRAWMKGDGYIRELVTQYALTPVDLIGILSALEKLEGPPSPPPPPKRGLDCYECGDPTPPWGPISDPNDHRGGPIGSGKPKPPPTVNPPPHPHGSGGTGGPGSHPPDPSYIKRLQDMMNGIEKGDPRPTSSPFDADYRPGMHDYKVDFKCEGRVYNGFKQACPDFQEKRDVTKVASKIGDFFKRNGEAYRAYVYHNVWSDGKNPQCMDTCNQISAVGCIGIGGALLVACVEATGGLCSAGAAGAAAGAALGSLDPALCMPEVTKRCRDDICIH